MAAHTSPGPRASFYLIRGVVAADGAITRHQGRVITQAGTVVELDDLPGQTFKLGTDVFTDSHQALIAARRGIAMRQRSLREHLEKLSRIQPFILEAP